MTVYSYKATDKSGKFVEGDIDAPDITPQSNKSASSIISLSKWQKEKTKFLQD